MHRKRNTRLMGLTLAALLVCASCLGPNHAVGHLAKWNSEIDGKWGNEVCFVLLLPVYVVFAVGDQVVFNSIQWWTGKNPISRPGAEPGPTL